MSRKPVGSLANTGPGTAQAATWAGLVLGGVGLVFLIAGRRRAPH